MFKFLTWVHKGNCLFLLVDMFLTIQIRFSYFCRRSSSAHFYQIILNSDHRFQWRRLLKIVLLMDQMPLALFRGSSGDQFCQIIFSFDHWFQRTKILKVP